MMNLAKPSRFAILWWLVAALCLVSCLTRLAFVLRPDVSGSAAEMAGAFLVGMAYDLVAAEDKNHFSPDALNELAGNGLHEFAAAARSNELDFMRLYATLPDVEAFSLVRGKQFLTANGWRSPDIGDRLYGIRSAGAEKHLNVVLVSAESLGAEFMGSRGDLRSLTPPAVSSGGRS